MPSPTSVIFEALHQTLANEVEDYHQLVNLTQRERAVLQNGNLTDLITIVQSKESLLNRLATWQKIRQEAMTILIERLQLPVPASLSDLMTYCDEAINQKLSALRQEFINLVEQLGILNQGNQLLLQAELVRVNGTLNFVLATLTPSGQYMVSGFGSPGPGNILNRQI